MTARGSYIAVDWGTTNRRTYLVGSGGQVEDAIRDERGVTSVALADFPAAIDELRQRLGPAPLLMAGMIGSNRGLVEVPYVACPATVETIAAGARKVDEHGALIVPGVRIVTDDRADVMRGEEVQLLGAVAAGWIAPNMRACHPGTHAKWAKLDQGAITDFRTIMTGELFALLRKHSVLASQLEAEAEPGPAFLRGVARSLAHPDLPADLFAVRAMGLSGLLRDEEAASHTSGLLIGADIRIGMDFVGPGTVALIGDPDLTALYGAALAEAGRDFLSVDGEEAFLAGMKVLAGRLL